MIDLGKESQSGPELAHAPADYHASDYVQDVVDFAAPRRLRAEHRLLDCARHLFQRCHFDFSVGEFVARRVEEALERLASAHRASLVEFLELLRRLARLVLRGIARAAVRLGIEFGESVLRFHEFL